MDNENLVSKKKFFISIGIALLLGIFLSSIFFSPSEKEKEIITDYDKIKTELTSTKDKLAKLNNTNKENKQLKKEIAELEAKVEEAAPWFKMSEQEKVQKEKEIAEAKARQEKEEADKKAKEEELARAKAEADKKAKEEAEKVGYETGVTYEQLARTPDDFIAKKIKFSGKVLQVMEGDDETQIRLAINSNYDNVLLCGLPKSLTSNKRILEDDMITIYGYSVGLYTYKSTLGGNITIPAAMIDKFELN